jgi:hypothetical protein
MFDLYRDRKVKTSFISKAIDALLRGVMALLAPFVKRYNPELIKELHHDGPRLSLGLRSADRTKENP